MNKSQTVPGAEGPEKLTGLKQRKIKKIAAGIPAVLSSAQKIVSEAGVVRGLKALSKLNKKSGFDCPSCAWPDPDDERSRLGEYCENGARAVAEEATTKSLTPFFFKKYSVNELAGLSDHELGSKGRIAQPMFLAKEGTHYIPITWDDAFTKIGTELNALTSPDEAIFYTSGRTGNEAAFLYQLFVREYGTNNLPDCSNMCHESSGVALNESLGIGKGSVSLEDMYEAEVIIILGQNPGTNHPRMLTALQRAKVNGAKIISINPLPETGLMAFSNPQMIKGILRINTELTDLFLQVKINGDMALLQAIELLLIQEEEKNPGKILDRDFIENNTTGFNELKTHLYNLDPNQLAHAAGIAIEKVIEAVELLKHKKKIIACWAMGLTQHKNAVNTIKEIVNLLLLKGSIGKPGAGTCPVRGHSNVQGDRTMGIYEKPPSWFLNRLDANFGFTTPKHGGFDVVESIKAMHDGRAKVFIAMGGNFLSATPDTNFTAAALQKCSLTVQISTKLNRSHLIHGKQALILPVLARSDKDIIDGAEQFVSCENSMSVVQSSKGILKPISKNLLSEPVVVCKMAMATFGTGSKTNWKGYSKSYDLIRQEIERTIPGFENYNERVRKAGGFYLPNCNREGRFDTPTGKAMFNVAFVETQDLEDDELMMMTIRSHDQFNTTIYGLNDRYRGVFNERRVVFINQIDIDSRGLKNGDVVDLVGTYEGVERIAHSFVIVNYPIPVGCVATYFPEANVLVPLNSVAYKSNTPTSKMVIIRILHS